MIAFMKADGYVPSNLELFDHFIKSISKGLAYQVNGYSFDGVFHYEEET